MEVREVFARNLRNLCETQPSIASVCRDVDINRQQFARYLSGKGLPNAGNLEKICEYFGIVEAELFSSNRLVDANQDLKNKHPVSHQLMSMLDDEELAHIDPGLYFVDFTGPQHENTVVRSVLIVRRLGNIMAFRRITGFGERRSSWWSQYYGDHQGVIIERRGNFYFLGINSTGTREPSMLVLRYAVTDRFVLVGHASIIGPTGPTTMAAVITAAPKAMNLRGALRNARSHAVDAPTIPMDVIDLLDIERHNLAKKPAPLIHAIPP
ncbi:MAG: helix-turn-helix transcriptional regulator [Rhizobiales bacterium]|nr:helix-turn-helix transcriptional regulator [Hyphomicrobiales bacterium]MBO6698149.1 helix-turn-helix transcriptional regulator [Hyphomicrobiales bacterium]MBO6735597.1 helix-turn-helix transcriptional regulator [Hyphomicrobiales bacterium]MBO6910595.1 helix-turn-helix transcriptional regulator [Hyphomicrobiales bacterium]